MPLKQHPTDPDKMVYASRQYGIPQPQGIPQLQGVTTTQPAQEPVAWMHPVNKTCVTTDPTAYARGTPLYTAPPQRTWVELEGEEIRNLWEEATKPDRSTVTIVTSFARAIEAKLKEKNT